MRRNVNNVIRLQIPKKLRFQDVFKLKHILFLVILYFFIFLGFNIFYTSFPIYAVDGLKWTIIEMGIFNAVLSGIMVFVQGPVLRKALKKFSEEKLVIIGSIILGINFILFVSNNNILIYGAEVLFAVGNELMWPSFMSILSKSAGKILFMLINHHFSTLKKHSTNTIGIVSCYLNILIQE